MVAQPIGPYQPPNESFDAGGFGAGIALNFATGGGWGDVALDAFMELIFAADDAAIKELSAGFEVAQRGYTAKIDNLVKEIDGLRKAGQAIPQEKLFSLQRYRDLEDSLRNTGARYGRQAEDVIRSAQSSAVHIAGEAAEKEVIGALLDEGLKFSTSGFNRFPDRAFSDMVGRLHDGSPLSDLLTTLGDSQVKAAKETLLKGVAQGINSDVLGGELARATGIAKHRAIAISRTSTFNSFREAKRRSWLANPRLVRGWVWQSSRDKRSCMACIMRDGTVYPLSAKMPAHVNCRCRMRPLLRDAKNYRRGTGREWFDLQPEDIRREMLGPKTWKALQEGAIDLGDLAGFVVDPRWGASSPRRSLAEAKSFAAQGRPYHTADVPPGLLTVADAEAVRGQIEPLLAQLKELKMLAQQVGPAPDWVDEFVDCMGQ